SRRTNRCRTASWRMCSPRPSSSAEGASPWVETRGTLRRGLGPAAQGEAAAFARHDPFWPAQLTVLAAIVLSLDLPSYLTIREVWLIPAIEGVLLVALVALTPGMGQSGSQRRRIAPGPVRAPPGRRPA